MRAVKLKICGITNLDDALAASAAGSDWLGFNFYEKSPRYLRPKFAAKIIAELDDSVQTVGILVKPTRDEIDTVITESGVSMLQIYEPQDFKDLSLFSLPTIICYRIKRQSRQMEYPMLNANMILFDSYDKNVLGGSGKQFNWDLIPKSIEREKLVLAGGITPQNISLALKSVSPAVIDVASGAEKSPGIKDIKKIKKMAEEVKKYNENRI